MPDPFPGRWPRNPLIYELYPRSFQDSDGDGIGDLPGIVRRLDHIEALGVDAVWICPFTESPWVDGGYDPSSYTAIHPKMGTEDDFAALVADAHGRGIRVMVDLVLNHTSDRHPWFLRSVAREDPYTDYYVWHDAKPDGSAPNNWITRFGEPAWSWHHKREQYFLHNYMQNQPGLDLRCDLVHEEIAAVIKVWLDRGVDGFRFDAVTSYLYDPDFRDNPPASPEARAKMDGEQFLPYVRQDHLHDFLPGDGVAYTENLRRWCGEDRYLLGEIGTGNKSVEVTNDITEPGRLNAGYTVDIAQNGLTADTLADMLERSCRAEGLAWWIESHDRARQVDGPDDPMVRLHLFFLATIPGAALVYMGQELGLPQPELKEEEVTDPYDRSFWPDGPGRENARVPMPWQADGPAYGFTKGEPWLPMRWPEGASVAEQEKDAPLAFARQAFAMRRELSIGEATLSDWSRQGETVAIDMDAEGVALHLMLNLGDEAAAAPDGMPALHSAAGDWTGTLPPKSGAIWRR